MFHFMLDNELSKWIISKSVAKWINNKFDCDAGAKFNDIHIVAFKETDTVCVHLDLDVTMSKEKLLEMLNKKL